MARSTSPLHSILLPTLLACTTLGSLAACGGTAKPTAPTAGAGATITIRLGAPDSEFGIAGFDDGGALPAISADGTMVAALFHDTVDMVGVPIDTVVVWRIADGSRVGAVASNDGEPPDLDTAPVADPGRAVKATELLAGHTWVKVATPPEVTPADQASGVEIALGDGATLRFAEEVFFVLESADALETRGTVTPKAFAGPGDGSDEIGGGECGTIGGVTVLAAGGDWLLVAPDQIDLGGDSCIGRYGAELAMIIKVAK